MFAAAASALVWATQVGAAESVALTATDSGGVREVFFEFAVPVSARASLRGQKLSIEFDHPLAADIAELANSLGKNARLVRLSPDQRTIRANLTAGTQVFSKSSGNTVTVVLLGRGAQAPAGYRRLGEDPISLYDGPNRSPQLAAEPAPDAGVSAPSLAISRTKDYARLTFRHPQPVMYEVALSEGELKIRFQSDEPVNITELRVDPPQTVRTAEGSDQDGWFTVDLQLQPGTGVRHFQEGAATVVDLVRPVEPDPQEVAQAPAEEAKDQDGHGEGDGHSSDGPEGHAEKIGTREVAYEDIADPADLPKEAADHALDNEPEAAGMPLIGHAQADEVVMSQSGPGVTKIAGTAEPLQLGQIRPTVSFGQDGITLTFPFQEPVAAAVTRRGERLWVAFSGHGSIDIEPLAGLGDDGVQSIDVFADEAVTVLGLTVEPQLLATVVSAAPAWQLKLGNAILTPPPSIAVEKIPSDEGGEVIARVASSPSIARFIDPDVGDELILVMLEPPVAGFVNPRTLVEFDFLPTAQGIAIRPLSDGLQVARQAGGVVITREGGLHLSGSNMAALIKAELPETIGTSPAFLDFDAWKGPPDTRFRERHDALLHEIAEAHETGQAAAELELAKFLLAYGLAEEALGVLRVASSDEPQIESDPTFRITRAAANLLTNRLREAERDLNSKDVPDDLHVTLWRAFFAATEHRWPEARILFDEADRAIGMYNDEWQMLFRLAAARAALAVNDLAAATTQMDLLPTEGTNPYLKAESLLLRGRIAQASGDAETANGIFADLATSTVEPLAAEAELHRVQMDLKSGKIQVSEAIDNLEALRFRWRGDGTEVESLIALGELYTRIGDYRHGLSTLRIAVQNFPGTPHQRRASHLMAEIFEDLYLKGKADELPPIQALGLYYDFKELTPVGARGDLMIRRLADRLVAMDLLGQATELLQHQIDHRLRGLARSQVAVKLAMVQLLDNKPEAALRTIQTTRQARLPSAVASQRRLIEARALFEIGRHQHALDTISSDIGRTVERLRADIYWDADNWAAAAPAYVSLLEDVPRGEEPVSDQERFDIMRAAIAYTLAGDDINRDVLRERFSGVISQTPDARAFEIITAKDPGQSVEFRTLVERIAAVDTLSAFMADLKAQDADDTEMMN